MWITCRITRVTLSHKTSYGAELMSAIFDLVTFQFLEQRRVIDLQYLGRLALVAAGIAQHPYDRGTFCDHLRMLADLLQPRAFAQTDLIVGPHTNCQMFGVDVTTLAQNDSALDCILKLSHVTFPSSRTFPGQW